ncbi:putative bifunctional diguanylate cyclase/phosphodiesterase [Paenibacillus harenae]|uniref:putative bifunctional diguanylate cyclase/phosphodiesterase n=1 Tax=Paenibacillus harenae TaxID=306543 RepID=UPI00278DBF74|nr:bifunctional diguanylate cyclase/phosphodiesterase [Paenibacillus harenae]MDQ0062318.1 diguanylate cyclase (GGDEF)-like protein [Paenibacillus harenae]
MEALTGLSGRKEVFAQLETAVHLARAADNRLIVALVDLDRFYRLNATRGHEFGDEVLNIVGSRLEQAGPSPATVCRIGGNTYMVSMQLKHGTDSCLHAVEAIKHAVELPIDEDGTELYLTSSIGAALFPEDGQSCEQLVCRAESALHQSKSEGGNRTLFYNLDNTYRLHRRIDIEASLRPALYMRQFYLAYQPIFRVSDGKMRGFEALIRWKHPELGVISPAEFIPIAEHNGLIVPIGEWVLREACKRLAGMNNYGLGPLIISVNISPVQLQDPTFAQTVLHILDEHDIDYSSIELEITENVTLKHSEKVLSSLSKLRCAGVRIALDDFGTGYSSLVNLKQLPIHCLKIDKSFIREIDLPSAERLIVESLVDLVHKLGLEVIAEGVEYKEQYELLKSWGCDYVQGFLFGKPMNPGQLDLSMIKTNGTPASL